MEYCIHLMKFSLIMLNEHPIYGIFQSVASVMFSLTAIFGNAIVIYAFWIASSMNRTSRILLLSLAASDLGIGLLVQPINAAMVVQMLATVRSGGSADYQTMTFLCPLLTTFLFFSIFFCGTSLLTVGAISIDRYLALSLHLRYDELVTQARVCIAVSAIWITSFLAAILQTFLGFNDIINASGVVLVILVASFAYFRVYRIAFHHQNQICVHDGQQNQICQLTQFGRAKRLAMKTLYIYVILLICYVPSLFIFPAFMMSEAPTSFLTLFYYLGALLIFFNSCLNPLVYCWKICEVRETVVDVLKRMFSRWVPWVHQ